VFCPVCRDEYRPGFERCATCNVDLVESLDESSAASKGAPSEPSTPRVRQPMAYYCGFLSLEEARHARSQLKEARLASEILIRDGDDPDGPEEYWLRVEIRALASAQRILGYDEASHEGDDAEGDAFCSACGEAVGVEATSCPHCGERFEEA